MNRKPFFDALRGGILGETLSAQEVQGCEALLDACAGWPLSWTAYALATAYHETAGTMQPIHEYGTRAYFMRCYDVTGSNPTLARELGNTVPGDGARFAGRGYVQLTGRTNYRRMAEALRVDLVAQPDLAMQPSIAARILRHGMERGSFTGKGLSDFLPRNGRAASLQYQAARRIINGVDKARKIAGYAMEFEDALARGNWA